jgi:hypothetical protein
MNSKKAKAVRKAVYGKLPQHGQRQYGVTDLGQVVVLGLRGHYRAMKRQIMREGR